MPRKPGVKNKATAAKLNSQGGVTKTKATAASKKGSAKTESKAEQVAEQSAASVPQALPVSAVPEEAPPPEDEPELEAEAEAEPAGETEAPQSEGQAAGAVPEVVDLAEAEEKQRKVAEELRVVEKQIYDMETRYLENANPLGHAIKGYDGFLSNSSAASRRVVVKPADRLFSRSSLSGLQHLL